MEKDQKALDELRERIEWETLYEIVDELNYYQLLRLSPECGQAEIPQAFRRESQRLHPDQAATLPDMKEKSTYVFTAINEAFRVLKAADSRLAYDSLLESGQIRTQDTALKTEGDRGSSNDPANAATMDTSKKYWQLGLAAFDAKDYESSIMQIKFALQFEPKNEIFQEWLEKAKAELKKAPKKEKNPYKLRL
jgi:curved DNA-binding protein CbpA